MKTAIPTVTFVWLFQNLIFAINKIQNEVSSSAPSFPYATNYSFILYPHIFHDFLISFSGTSLHAFTKQITMSCHEGKIQYPASF